VPTRQHQRILAILLKRMKQRGFMPLAVDGPTECLGGPEPASPVAFGRHRPDAVGTATDGRMCIAEAKTSNDITSRRTREQLEDYLVASDVGYALVLFGYPRSADLVVQNLLASIGASACPQLELIPVPDDLLDA